MTNVVPFPKRGVSGHVPARLKPRDGQQATVDHAKVRGVAGKVLFGFLVVVGAFWPFLRWVLALDVFFKFVAMLWLWDKPGAHAGWVFSAHMAVLVLLTLLLASHKTKD
jgi:uncharacterized membrane protein YphA (DoxX/SURF4 family)